MAQAILHPDTQIFLCVSENPKVPNSGTWHRFNGYFNARTVGEALAAGVTRGDILWDIRHGYVLLDWDCPHAKPVPPRYANKAGQPAPEAVQAAPVQASKVAAKAKATKAAATKAKKPSSGIAAMVSQLAPAAKVAKQPRKAKQATA